MDWSTLIYIALIVALIVVIFKVVKKVLHAIFVVCMLFSLVSIILGVLVYMDVRDLSSQEQFDLVLVQEYQGELSWGVTIPVDTTKEEPVATDEIVSLNALSIRDLKIQELEKEDSKFAVVLNQTTYESLMKDNYDFAELFGDQLPSELDIDLKFTKQEMQDLLYSDEIQEDFTELILDKNDFGVFEEFARGPIESLVEQGIGDLELREAIWLVSVQHVGEEPVKYAPQLLESYSEEEVRVYPNTISFKLLKYLPVSFVTGFFESEDSSVEAEG